MTTPHQEVKVLKWEGSKPNEEEINRVLETKAEEGLQLVDTDLQFQIINQARIHVYTLIMYFEKQEDEIDLDMDEGMTTEELGEELEAQLDENLL